MNVGGVGAAPPPAAPQLEGGPSQAHARAVVRLAQTRGPMVRATPLRRQRLRGLHDRHAAATLPRDANLRILDRLGISCWPWNEVRVGAHARREDAQTNVCVVAC